MDTRQLIILGPAVSFHIEKWVQGTNGAGLPITIFTMSSPPADSPLGKLAEVIRLPFPGGLGLVLNAVYLALELRRRPRALVHVHYASSYGLLALLTGVRPWVLSVWGSDVFEFPERSWIHRWLISAVLSGASHIFATSRVLRDRVLELTSGRREAQVIAFGVHRDWLDAPKSTPTTRPFRCITLKSLDPIYNIDVAIEAFAAAREMGLPQDSEFWIVGEGAERKRLARKAKDLGVASHVIFKGRVSHDHVWELMDQADVLLNLSIHESFGVAVIEASARGLPVIASEAGGLNEVVDPGVTGFLVPVGNSATTAQLILKLYQDPDLRRRMGEAGRSWVRSNYVFEENLAELLAAYRRFPIT